MKILPPLRLKHGPATPVSLKNAILYFGEKAVEEGERRFEFLDPPGAFREFVKIRGAAVTAIWKKGPVHDQIDEITLWGDRVAYRVRGISNTTSEGWLSLNSEKRSAFTTGMLFELPKGGLISVAVLHVRSKR